MVGELRSQYAVAVKMAAQRLADAVFATPSGSPVQNRLVLLETKHMQAVV